MPRLIATVVLVLVVSPVLAQVRSGGVPPATQPAGGWRPLFDGKTLAGWHAIGKGQWAAEDGMIVGRHDAKDDYGHLVTDKSFKDFTLRLKFKSLKGNSGVYFRLEEKGFSGVSGFQAEIDPRKDVGGLYETNGRAWVVQPTPEAVKSYFKPDEWNDMTVAARGGDITVTVNGKTAAEVKADPGKWRDGPIALQVHAGQEGLVYFEDLEIRDDGR